VYTLNQYFAMLRMDEFKYIWTAEIQGGFFQKGDIGGFSGPIATDTGGGVLVNLYTNPQEDVSIGIRHIPMAVPVMSAAGEYMKELIKYPPQFKIGFLSNNPPIYDLIPNPINSCANGSGIPNLRQMPWSRMHKDSWELVSFPRRAKPSRRAGSGDARRRGSKPGP
jgi:hypothetical protein